SRGSCRPRPRTRRRRGRPPAVRRRRGARRACAAWGGRTASRTSARTAARSRRRRPRRPVGSCPYSTSMPRDRNEPVRLTKVYTRGGDAGQTSLGDGSRASKLDPRIRAYGMLDELNSELGVVLAGELPNELRPVLTQVQNELFDVGADLSTPYDGPDERL